MKKAGWLAVAFVALTWLAVEVARLPSELALDDSCKPAGALNTVREWVHSSRFWRPQLALLDAEVEALVRWDERRAEAAAERRSLSNKFDSELGEIRAQYGIARPLRSSADSLRDIADSIDAAEFNRFVDSLSSEMAASRAADLIACREGVVRRA